MFVPSDRYRFLLSFRLVSLSSVMLSEGFVVVETSRSQPYYII